MLVSCFCGADSMKKTLKVSNFATSKFENCGYCHVHGLWKTVFDFSIN